MNIFEADSIPSLYPTILNALLSKGSVVGPRGLVTYELEPALFISHNPRKRLFGHPARMDVPIFTYIEGLWILLGESTPYRLVHYAKGMEEFVNKITGELDGAYGPRLRRLWPLQFRNWTFATSSFSSTSNGDSLDQLSLCFDRLKKDPDTRQAVCTIYNPIYDWGPTKDLPCTMSFQFLIRNSKLDMIVHMRSQDAWWGFIYDTGEFQWFQEIMAGWLGIDVGTYYHFDGSLHLYERDWEQAKKVLAECDVLPLWNLYEKEIESQGAYLPLRDSHKAEILDARLGREDFLRVLRTLGIWEETCRRGNFAEMNVETEKEDFSGVLNSDFYLNLMDLILAYNLRLKKEYDAANEIIKHNRSDLGLVYRNRWLKDWP